jgi:hypothetical protein
MLLVALTKNHNSKHHGFKIELMRVKYHATDNTKSMKIILAMILQSTLYKIILFYTSITRADGVVFVALQRIDLNTHNTCSRSY